MSYDIDMALSASLPAQASSETPARPDLSDIKEVSITFTTHLSSIPSLPSSPFTVPVHLTRFGLSELLNHLLSLPSPRPFDFLIDGSFLRSSLLAYLQTKTEGVGEMGLTVEVVEAMSTPHSSHSSRPHPDWIASVHSLGGGMVVTGCYDRQVRIVKKRGRGVEQGEDEVEDEVVGEGHTLAVKSVRMSRVGGAWKVVSGSKDHTVRVWDVDGEGDGLHCSAVGHRHTSSVEAVCWLEGTQRFVSGGWDQQILIWDLAQFEAGGEEAPVKKAKGKSAIPRSAPHALTPVSLITASTDVITGLCSPFPTTLFSSSSDSSLRQFDLTLSTQSSIWWLGGGKSLTSLDLSSDSRTAAVGAWDGVVRVVDLRVREGTAMQLKSHTNAVSGVSWSPVRGWNLVSGGYDGVVKVWDVRARVPLMTLRREGKEEKVLTVQWSEGEEGKDGQGVILSGGSDKRLHRHSWTSTE